MNTIKSIKITYDQYEQISTDLREKYPPSIFLIRKNMIKKAGFLFRFHRDLVGSIFIDFFDEKKYSLFILTYPELNYGNKRLS